MPKPYYLRERVVRAVEAGASCHEAAAAFEVSPSSAIPWVARWRQTGSVAPQPMGGKRSPLDAHKQWLLELIAAEPDLTLEEIRGRLRQRGIKVSASSVWRFLSAMTSPSKKSLHAAEQDREDVRKARANWKQEQPRLDPFVFIDETGTSTNITRLRGRCPRGKRFVAKVPHGHWKMTTFVAGLRQDRMTAPFVVDAAMNGEIFLTYLRTMSGAHPLPRRDHDHEQSPRPQGCRVPPALSPRSQPTEQSFAKLKAHLRKVSERSIPALCGIGSELSSKPSLQGNATTTSNTPVRAQTERNRL